MNICHFAIFLGISASFRMVICCTKVLPLPVQQMHDSTTIQSFQMRLCMHLYFDGHHKYKETNFWLFKFTEGDNKKPKRQNLMGTWSIKYPRQWEKWPLTARDRWRVKKVFVVVECPLVKYFFFDLFTLTTGNSDALEAKLNRVFHF